MELEDSMFRVSISVFSFLNERMVNQYDFVKFSFRFFDSLISNLYFIPPFPKRIFLYHYIYAKLIRR